MKQSLRVGYLGNIASFWDSIAWRQFYQMTKPTITYLVVFTVLPGLFLAASDLASLRVGVVCAALIGTALSSASAAVFNQLVDQSIDAKMKRTMNRPLPLGSVTAPTAALYGVVLGLAGFLILGLGANWFCAVIALAANVFYVVVYTLWLKKRTKQNIVIGGAAGAVGPLIGWAAVQADLSWEAWALFAVIFLWTPPHFWALALKYRDDYAAANIPMLPVVAGPAKTRGAILRYSLSLFLPFALFYYLDTFSLAADALCFLLTGWFVLHAFKLWNAKNNEHAMKLFFVSCIYLLLVFLVVGVDGLMRLL